jgi:hypothetical protein
MPGYSPGQALTSLSFGGGETLLFVCSHADWHGAS